MINSQAQHSCLPWLLINEMVEPGSESDDKKLFPSRLNEKKWINEDAAQQNTDKMHSICQPVDGK